MNSTAAYTADLSAADRAAIARTVHTPGYRVRLTIRFTADRNGRPLAHRYSPFGYAGRWLRMGYDEAKMFVAQDLADEYSR